jgi:hypothetical protein
MGSLLNQKFLRMLHGPGECAKRRAQGAKRIIRFTLCEKRYAPSAFPLAAGGIVLNAF